MCLFESVEGIRCSGVLGFIRVNQEGFLAILDFDVAFWDTGLEV